MMEDLARIKANVAKMASMNAPEEDIDGYIASEGVTVDDVRNFQEQKAKPSPQQADDLVGQATKAAFTQMMGKMPVFGGIAEMTTAPVLGDVIANPKEAGRTVLDQGLGGMTMQWGDEATDKIGAGIAELGTAIEGTRPVNAESSQALMQEARQGTQERLASQWEKTPALALASQLMGGALTGKAIGGTDAGRKFVEGSGKVGAAIGGSGSKGKVIQDMLVATPAAAASAAGAAKDGEGLSWDTARNAGLGIGAAGIASGANQLLGKIASPKTATPTAEELRKQASASYKTAQQKGGTLDQSFTNDFLNDIGTIKPKPIAGKLLTREDKALIDTIDEYMQLKDTPLELEDIQRLDESLGAKLDNFIDPKTGKPNKDGMKILDLQSKLRDMVDNVDPAKVQGGKEGFEALKQGRKDWQKSRKLMDIERIVQRAESMDNPATGIKTGFRTLLNNPNRLRGYSKAEQELIKNAAESGVASDVMRTLGSRLIPIGSMLAGNGLGGNLAAYAGAAASRGAASKMQTSKAMDLAKLVAGGQQQPLQIPALAQLLLK
jgi:hypothetical protein